LRCCSYSIDAANVTVKLFPSSYFENNIHLRVVRQARIWQTQLVSETINSTVMVNNRNVVVSQSDAGDAAVRLDVHALSSSRCSLLNRSSWSKEAVPMRRLSNSNSFRSFVVVLVVVVVVVVVVVRTATR
jgi:hypothetical protein